MFLFKLVFDKHILVGNDTPMFPVHTARSRADFPKANSMLPHSRKTWHQSTAIIVSKIYYCLCVLGLIQGHSVHHLHTNQLNPTSGINKLTFWIYFASKGFALRGIQNKIKGYFFSRIYIIILPLKDKEYPIKITNRIKYRKLDTINFNDRNQKKLVPRRLQNWNLTLSSLFGTKALYLEQYCVV